MIRIFSAVLASALVLLSASCCCTGEVGAPRLRPLPKFQEVETAPAPVEIEHTK